ncbi:MAG: prepilin-type N-terminal cleavage/methylation domain-containing protein [Planctomycetota bacterium]
MKRNQHGFTLIELLVVISIIALLIGILLPALGAARRSARQVTNSTQLRGIHQGMVTFAQGNNGFFPGIEGDGTFNEGEPAILNTNYGGTPTLPSNSVAIMLNDNLFVPEYCNNPEDGFVFEVDITVDAAISDRNFSYGMLELHDANPGANPGDQSPDRARAIEWSETLNTAAVVMSDKNTGGDGVVGSLVSSVWTDQNSGDWRGTVVRNDNSTTFEASPELENTRYGTDPINEFDNLFLEDGGPGGTVDNDAAMIINAWGQYTNHGV